MRPIDADKLPEHKFTRESAKSSDYMRGWNDAIDAIVDNEPTVERPHGEWIPVSERLPDRFGDVLVTFQKPNREPLVYRAVYGSGKFNLDNGDAWNWNDPEIKAWMPLPEPYKEEEHD